MFYDGSSGELKTYNFDQTETGDATLVNIVDSSLYSGATTLDTETIYDVSDDCKGIRINNIIILKNSDDVLYSVNLPSSVSSLINTVFSADFSLFVTSDGIYSSNPNK